ncbi:MAG TPA: ABATE domain-containing protein [Vicinamibacterales bacterium]|nr:ABATE domain-containing protein [Vicinamibacterales bacterium]
MVTTRNRPKPPGGSSSQRSEPDYRFDFCGNHLAIDFTNTVGDRGGDRGEHLKTFGDIVAWAEARGVISRSAAAALRQTADADPEGAHRAWRSALMFREALYNVLAAASSNRRARPADLAVVNDHVADTFKGAALAQAGERFLLETPAEEWLDPVLRPVTRAAVDLLTSDDLSKVGRCADEECAWLFLDTTRSRSRRWCDMRVCGNRSKVRRFRETE